MFFQLIKKPWILSLMLVCIALSIVGYQIVRAVTMPPYPMPPILGAVPEFRLIDQDNQPFGSDELKGSVWIVNFIFTRCPTVCPLFTSRMAKVQHRIRHAASSMHLVSFTVDPDFDTPEILKAYAKKYKSSSRLWSFVTGDSETIQTTVREGFKMSMEQKGTLDNDIPNIIHGTHFVLVDQHLNIRGYYKADDDDDTNRMIRDADALLNFKQSL